MDAVVLAGGYATRLWPITKLRAKPLLPLAGDPIIEHILEPLEAEDRVDRVYISTNKRFEEDFQEYLDRKSYGKVSIAVEPTWAEEEKLGTIGALAELVDREDLDNDTLVIAGDNLFSFEVSDFLEYYFDHEAACIAAYDVGSREDAKQYGLVSLDGGRVVNFQEKPDNPKSTLVSIACYAFPDETLRLLDEYLESGKNPDAPGFFVEWLHTRENVYAYVFDGAWYDIGTPESYLQANSYLLGGESLIEDDVEIIDSDIGSNSYVMSGARIVNSVVENSIVFRDAEITDCTVRGSIIDRKTVVGGVDFQNALIGEHTQLNG